MNVFIDAGAVAVITADEQHRGGKINHLKAAVDEALAMGETDFVKSVIVYKRERSGNPPLNTRARHLVARADP